MSVSHYEHMQPQHISFDRKELDVGLQYIVVTHKELRYGNQDYRGFVEEYSPGGGEE